MCRREQKGDGAKAPRQSEASTTPGTAEPLRSQPIVVTGVKIGFSIAVPRTPPEACFLLAFPASGEVVRVLVWAFQPKLLQVVVTAVRWSIHLQAGRLHQVKPLQPVSLVCRVLAQVTDLMSLRQT